MRNDTVKPANAEKMLSPQPVIDNGPRIYTPRELFFSGVKMAAVFGIIFVMLWLFEKL